MPTCRVTTAPLDSLNTLGPGSWQCDDLKLRIEVAAYTLSSGKAFASPGSAKEQLPPCWQLPGREKVSSSPPFRQCGHALEFTTHLTKLINTC